MQPYDTPCWPTEGKLTHDGYRRYWLKDRMVSAHRVAWEEATGQPVLSGQCVLHTCDLPSCRRNDDQGVYVVDGVEYPRRGHLWLGDQKANARDRELKGRGNHATGDRNGSRTHPEKLPYGDLNWTRRHPEKITWRGDNHWKRRGKNAP